MSKKALEIKTFSTQLKQTLSAFSVFNYFTKAFGFEICLIKNKNSERIKFLQIQRCNYKGNLVEIRGFKSDFRLCVHFVMFFRRELGKRELTWDFGQI